MNKQLPLQFIFIGIIINTAGFYLNYALNLPLFLDSIGTILAAVTLGPWFGALTGFSSNLVVGLYNSVNIPFGIVNAIIGIITGYISLKKGFEDYLTPLYTGFILAVICPVLATPIAVYLFGGVTGGFIDSLFVSLIQSGNKIFSSAFLSRLPSNCADKFISSFVVFFIIKIIPVNMRGFASQTDSTD